MNVQCSSSFMNDLESSERAAICMHFKAFRNSFHQRNLFFIYYLFLRKWFIQYYYAKNEQWTHLLYLFNGTFCKLFELCLCNGREWEKKISFLWRELKVLTTPINVNCNFFTFPSSMYRNLNKANVKRYNLNRLMFIYMTIWASFGSQGSQLMMRNTFGLLTVESM